MSILELAKDGDLFIRAGTGSTVAPIIRVQSIFLKAASPVFLAMLGDRFREGSTCYTEQKPLDMPEDHGKAFTELCAILHHKPSRRADYTLLVDLTIVADKYQCLDPVRPYILMALHPFFGQEISEPDNPLARHGLNLIDAVCITYILGDAQLFWRASCTASVNWPEKHWTGGAGRLSSCVPGDVWNKIQDLRIKLLENLGTGLLQSEKEQYQSLYDDDGCEGLWKAIGYYRQKLYNNGLVGLPDSAELDTVCEIWRIIRIIASSIDNFSCGDACDDCPRKMKTSILIVVEDNNKEVSGLCLKCEKTSFGSREAKVCQHIFDK